MKCACAPALALAVPQLAFRTRIKASIPGTTKPCGSSGACNHAFAKSLCSGTISLIEAVDAIRPDRCFQGHYFDRALKMRGTLIPSLFFTEHVGMLGAVDHPQLSRLLTKGAPYRFVLNFDKHPDNFGSAHEAADSSNWMRVLLSKRLAGSAISTAGLKAQEFAAPLLTALEATGLPADKLEIGFSLDFDHFDRMGAAEADKEMEDIIRLIYHYGLNIRLAGFATSPGYTYNTDIEHISRLTKEAFGIIEYPVNPITSTLPYLTSWGFFPDFKY
ncbi:MAG: hypothetical protein WC490_02365 [Candidatus Margulisiibacteriota bacterium]